LVSQGITATASVRFVGVPWATWQAWLKKNHEQARDKYEFAYSCHLEVMADNTLRIFEQLKAERDAALKAYNEAHRVWREWKPPAEEPKTPRPPEPIYEGPTDLDVRLAVRPTGLENPIGEGERPCGRFDLLYEYGVRRITRLLENCNPYSLRHDFLEEL
jgi:hypothetical protein